MDCMLEIGALLMEVRSVRWRRDTIPRNFRPFVRHARSVDGAARLRVESRTDLPDVSGQAPLSTSYNDLGQASLYSTPQGWVVALTPQPGQPPRLMRMSPDLLDAVVWLPRDDPHYDFVMDSMARIFFSQHAAGCHSLMLHASVVELDGRGYLFMGESGIGKSTHSRLWRETFGDCRLLNDDCPLVTADGRGGFLVSGTPWSGKTPCYRKATCRVAGIARLRQAPYNRFTPLEGVEAFVNFIPGMSVMTSARQLYSEATTTALALLEAVPFGILECRPEGAAAQLLYAQLNEELKMHNA